MKKPILSLIIICCLYLLNNNVLAQQQTDVWIDRTNTTGSVTHIGDDDDFVAASIYIEGDNEHSIKLEVKFTSYSFNIFRTPPYLPKDSKTKYVYGTLEAVTDPVTMMTTYVFHEDVFVNAGGGGDI